MTWQFIETKNLTDQWQATSALSGNLFKLVHDCSLPSQYSWNYTGLIGQILLDDNSQLYGEVQRLYFFPNSQYFLFNPLENINSRKLALKGYWSKQTTFIWNVDIFVWDAVIKGETNSTIDLTELTNLNNQQLTLLNQQSILLNQIDGKSNQIITDISNLTFGGGNAGGNGNGNGNGNGGNPNLGI